jgi:competence protein ComEA
MNRASTNLQVTVIGIAVLIVLGGVLWFGLGPQAEPPVPTTAVPQAVGEELIVVHVSGAVVRPGVVTVRSGARVADVVAAAGGATRRADLSAVNLAAPVRDGEYVVVPDPADEAAAGGGLMSDGVDINSATASELEGLSGVGPVLASRIVAYRDANGPFDAVEDLLDVPGIGEAKLAGMRDDIAHP